MSQSLDATLRGPTTQDLILIAFVNRLRDQIVDYNDQNCWESDDPIPLTHPGGSEFCTVSFGDGQFPTEFFAGSGSETLTEMGAVIIAPTVKLAGDRPQRRRRRIADDPDGVSLLSRKRQILRALFREVWEPAAGLQPLLRDLPNPVSCSAPAEVKIGEAKMLQMRITVRTVFDWDINSDEATP